MRRPAIIIPVILLALVCSCKKKSVSVTPGFVYIPWNLDSLMPTTTEVIISPSRLTLNGVMVANKLTADITDTSGNTNLYTRVWEAAFFTSGISGSNNADVTAVSVNNAALNIGQYLCFAHYDTMPLWNESTLNHWDIAGSDKIPAFSADVSGLFPVFSGTLPVNISTSTDFSFSFNSSNIANGDSAYVVMYSDGEMLYSNIVSANGGTVNISAEKMGSFKNDYLPVFYSGSNVPIYNGGLIMLVIYNHTIQTIGGKQFAFVKQREVLGVIKFI